MKKKSKFDISGFLIALILFIFFIWATKYVFELLLQSFTLLYLAAFIMYLSIALIILVLYVWMLFPDKSKMSEIIIKLLELIFKLGIIGSICLVILEALFRLVD
jgi:hypothetical protein